ncbi:hypothetical protein C900_03796 [Fulvivirga imtechensis AK7]|uniref:Uncharacterized protein n=1 Tax=Fulvivirga imtechensis AK7 TaxID=1237149 RepID=L8JMG8_9BACT|nr:hypothetical protein [Fulvivirga imtechensis]ELR70111.1 hypothetical protein C900_03796 [Fulvivirga imtechensis AK7]
MKSISTILTLSLIFLTGIAFGQGYTFKVLANKGTNKIKAGADWEPLKTGASLQDNDELVISENAYLGLVHASGKTLELKAAGNHKVSDLAAKVNTGGSSVASKYADFVLSKMSAEGKKNRLSATGAVHRGSNDAIHVFMPSSVGVFSDKAIIRWDSVDGENVYVVTLKNMFDDVLVSIETNEPNIELDLTNEKLSKENVVLLSVTSKGDEEVKSGTYAIKRLPEADATKVKETLNALMSDVDQATALNKYILAGFYEENNLLIDALTSYEEAIKLAPEVDSYREAYVEFLLRNRLGE